MTNTLTGGEIAVAETPPRMAWVDLIPNVFKDLVRLDANARSGLDHALLEPVKIRASQINCPASTKTALPSPAGMSMMEKTESASRFVFGVTLYRVGVMCEPHLNSMRTAKGIRQPVLTDDG